MCSSPGSRTRIPQMPGQTTLDFAVGVSVFRIVVAFVLAFVPTMLQPFDGSSQGETALTDRLAE